MTIVSINDARLGSTEKKPALRAAENGPKSVPVWPRERFLFGNPVSTPFPTPRPDQPARRISDRLQDWKRWQWKVITGIAVAYSFWLHQQLISQFANAANADAAGKAVGRLSERTAEMEAAIRESKERMARFDGALFAFGSKLDRHADATTALTVQIARLNDLTAQMRAEARGVKP